MPVIFVHAWASGQTVLVPNAAPPVHQVSELCRERFRNICLHLAEFSAVLMTTVVSGRPEVQIPVVVVGFSITGGFVAATESLDVVVAHV